MLILRLHLSRLIRRRLIASKRSFAMSVDVCSYFSKNNITCRYFIRCALYGHTYCMHERKWQHHDASTGSHWTKLKSVNDISDKDAGPSYELSMQLCKRNVSFSENTHSPSSNLNPWSKYYTQRTSLFMVRVRMFTVMPKLKSYIIIKWVYWRTTRKNCVSYSFVISWLVGLILMTQSGLGHPSGANNMVWKLKAAMCLKTTLVPNLTWRWIFIKAYIWYLPGQN